MANVQSINPSGALSGTSMTSGTIVSLSGVKDDYAVNILIDADADGPVTLNASDEYPNAENLTVTCAEGSMYALYNLDGTKYRQSDGTMDVDPDISGTVYSWQ